MSKIALSGNASGTGTLTIAAPNTNTDYTLTLPTEAGTVLTSGGAIDVNANAPADSLAINSSGNVGIGTSSLISGAKFQVKTATDKNFFIGTNSVGYLNDAGSSWVQTDVKGSSITFGTGQFAVEAARITTTGVLLVGTTAANDITAVNANNLALGGKDLSGAFGMAFNSTSATGTQYFIAWGRNGTSCGSITSTGTNSTSYNTSSDYRLKENIAPMTGALATIAQLKPCTYTWKEDGAAGQGFIAHELQAIVPECVTGEKDAVDADSNPQYQGVDTSFLVATLTAAIQELKAQLDSSNLTLTSVKAELDTVKAELADLKGQA
jgi:hypothetical protein